MNLSVLKKLTSIFHHNQKILFDCIVLFSSILILDLTLRYFDVSESIYIYTQTHQSYNLDEIILTIACSFFFLFIFTVRRLSDYKYMIIKADTDPLLGVLNRRKGNELITSEFQKLKNRPSSLIMFDIDNFKKINDTFGHDVGDDVLREITIILERITRKNDKIIRWGGEEFIILCPKLNLDEAHHLAERLRETIELHSFEFVHQVTASFGVIALNKEEDLRAQVIKLDNNLYISKREGKNRVTKI